MRRADERLRLRLAEGVLDAVGLHLLGGGLARGEHDPQLLLRAVGVPGRQARHPDADVRVLQLGVDCQRRAELLLGGARAALLEEAPSLGEERLRVGRLGRRRGGLLVGGEVALLVLLPRAAGAGVVAPGGGEARARLRGIDLEVGLRGLGLLCLGLGPVLASVLASVLRLGGLGLFGRHRVVSVVAGDGTIP